jgi:AcrR family transcriptional regulator
MAESRSLRIAAELRAQIESGELAPGARVPSAREITRRWGVAVATASRALAALRDDGLVRPLPGVGTVVVPRSAPRTARPRRRAEPVLSFDRIIAAAVVIADAEGLDGLSMRRVASELGAAPMSLYRHVEDKDDLLLGMMDRTLREAPLPDEAPADWRASLEVAARALWAAFRRHPWLAAALSLTRPQAVAGGLAYTEWVLEALWRAGLRTTVAFDVHLTLFTFIRGTAINLESEAAAQAASGLTGEEWMVDQELRLRAVTAGGRFPHFERLVDGEYDLDLDGLFERGLRYLLDGLTAEMEREVNPA